MEENAKKRQDGGNKTLSISNLNLKKLHVLLHISTYELWVNIFCYVINIFCFLINYLGPLLIYPQFLHF